MLNRRSWMLLLAGLWALLPGVSRAEDPATGDASLTETLIFGLKPRTPEEEDFVEMVVARVEAKTLPVELVISTFRWARPKRPYPFPFFERALRYRAAQVGIDL